MLIELTKEEIDVLICALDSHEYQFIKELKDRAKKGKISDFIASVAYLSIIKTQKLTSYLGDIKEKSHDDRIEEIKSRI